ncbi:hypothetical protein Nepgr_005436 [Nepenthes gracilis]|uniref:Uncharacterized protein n=1 Tax=Nepenthes gracilis TaxID=150966 RepID=A0AAD3XGF4_NEPGR|nr:hypothetical protein Nepgr_005436 [Nepenthes gracilis]
MREVFLDVDPIVVSKLNMKKIAASGSPRSSLLFELKLQSIVENCASALSSNLLLKIFIGSPFFENVIG